MPKKPLTAAQIRRLERQREKANARIAWTTMKALLPSAKVGGKEFNSLAAITNETLRKKGKE
jgi:hypothetical protein